MMNHITGIVQNKYEITEPIEPGESQLWCRTSLSAVHVVVAEFEAVVVVPEWLYAVGE